MNNSLSIRRHTRSADTPQPQGSSIREEQLDIQHRRTFCYNIILFRQELSEKKHFENADKQTDDIRTERQNDKPKDRHVD